MRKTLSLAKYLKKKRPDVIKSKPDVRLTNAVKFKSFRLKSQMSRTQKAKLQNTT